MNRKKKIVTSIIGILIVSLVLIGFTYGYLLTRINDNKSEKSIGVSTENLELTYNDNSSEILGGNKIIKPSDEAIGSKTFSVTNTGDGVANYSVVLENMSIKNKSDNSDTMFESNDFRYTLTCKTKSGRSCNNEVTEQTVFPLSDVSLLNNDIAKNDVHTYTLTMWYLETGKNQSNDMGKTLNAKINIIDPLSENPYRFQKETLAYHIVNNSINVTNGTKLVSVLKTLPPIETTTWEYKKEDIQGSSYSLTPATGYYITYGEDYTVDRKTGKFTLVNPKTIKYSGSVDPNEIAGKYMIFSKTESEVKNTKDLTTIYKITTDVTSDSGITSNTIWCQGITTSSLSARNTASTERELSMALDDYGTSYYYRGGVKDNYLELNNICFRIVRIEGDGSIKLTLANNGPCSTSSIKTGLLENVRYGYTEDYVEGRGLLTYFDYEGYTGGLYTKLNEWYNSNMATVQNKLKNETWCLGGKTSRYAINDGSLLNDSSTNGSWYYETGKRLFKGGQATYKCASEADTVTGYVATLSADEVAYAGGTTNGDNYTYYLYDNAQDYYWILSRAAFDGSSEDAFRMNDRGKLVNYAVGNTSAVRPAITLAAGAQLLSGDGTQNNPYTIK